MGELDDELNPEMLAGLRRLLQIALWAFIAVAFVLVIWLAFGLPSGHIK